MKLKQSFDFDSLELLGLWRLTSDNHAFGGISALHVDEGEFLALGDSGKVFRFKFDGRMAKASLRARMFPGLSHRVPSLRDLDSEAMAFDPVSRHFWVGFETFNTVRRFSANFSHKLGASAPRAIRHWPENGGSEAMIRLVDGRFVLFSESAEREDGATEAVLFSGDPVAHPQSGVRFF